MDKKLKLIPVCSWCGSSQVVFDGSLSYNPITEQYEINNNYDSTDCLHCDGECGVEWVWCDDKGNILCESLTADDPCPACGTGISNYKIRYGDPAPAKFLMCGDDGSHKFLTQHDTTSETPCEVLHR